MVARLHALYNELQLQGRASGSSICGSGQAAQAAWLPSHLLGLLHDPSLPRKPPLESSSSLLQAWLCPACERVQTLRNSWQNTSGAGCFPSSLVDGVGCLSLSGSTRQLCLFHSHTAASPGGGPCMEPACWTSSKTSLYMSLQSLSPPESFLKNNTSHARVL